MVKILIEKVREGSIYGLGPLVVPGDVVDTGAHDVPALMRDGLVFCIAPVDAKVTADLGSPDAPAGVESVDDGDDPANSNLLSVLDGSIPQIATAVEGMAVEGMGADDLRALLDAERAGKTRKGVVALLTTAIAASDSPAG